MKGEKNTKPSFFKELGSFMKPYHKKYALSVVLSIFSVTAGIAAYGFVGKIVSMLFTGKPTLANVLAFAMAAAVCKMLNAFLLNLSTWISHKAAYHTLRDIREALSEKLLRLPMGYFEENGSGGLKTLLVDHVEGMEKTLAHVLPELTANLLAPFCCILWMFLIDWRLSLIALAWIMLGFCVTGGMMKDYSSKYEGQIKAFKRMNQAVVEYVNGIEVIKNFGQTDKCHQKYQDAVYGHACYNVNWQKETQKYASLGMAIAPFSIFPILIGGLIFHSYGTLEAGPLLMVILLSFGIFSPLMNAMNYFDQLAAMGTNASEIKAVLSYPELKRGAGVSIENTDIRYNNVSFSYKDGNKVLKNISLHIPEGSMLALVGPSGSGKSTIAKLLAGFWDADEGNIQIGGKPMEDFTQEQLNRLIAYVDQETFLFDETIQDNIRIGCPEATSADVKKAARIAGCDDFISALPQGYETRVGEAGGRLSGGERQRIAIVRAMIKNAPIMILDEATASTDPENEAMIQKALTAAAKEKTLIIVAHRLATIVNADQIAFIKDGQIEAMGTHEELLQICPTYKAMWELSEVNENV